MGIIVYKYFKECTRLLYFVAFCSINGTNQWIIIYCHQSTRL